MHFTRIGAISWAVAMLLSCVQVTTTLGHQAALHPPSSSCLVTLRAIALVTFAAVLNVCAATSFAGTFFVAPRFKDSFKEDVEWRDIHAALSATGVKSVEAKDAYSKCRG